MWHTFVVKVQNRLGLTLMKLFRLGCGLLTLLQSFRFGGRLWTFPLRLECRLWIPLQLFRISICRLHLRNKLTYFAHVIAMHASSQTYSLSNQLSLFSEQVSAKVGLVYFVKEPIITQ